MTPRDELEVLDREWMGEKERHDASVSKLELLGFVGWISMMSGFAFVMFGLWLDDPPRPLFPWPGVCMVLGACLVLGSLAFMIRIGRRRGAYNQAKWSYDYRREKLLQDIYTNGQDLENPEANTSS